MAILNNMSSIIKPGRATLVLGPPGAGKSTLLKAMAGKLSPHGLKVGLTPSCAAAPSSYPCRRSQLLYLDYRFQCTLLQRMKGSRAHDLSHLDTIFVSVS